MALPKDYLGTGLRRCIGENYWRLSRAVPSKAGLMKRLHENLGEINYYVHDRLNVALDCDR